MGALATQGDHHVGTPRELGGFGDGGRATQVVIVVIVPWDQDGLGGQLQGGGRLAEREQLQGGS